MAGWEYPKCTEIPIHSGMHCLRADPFNLVKEISPACLLKLLPLFVPVTIGGDFTEALPASPILHGVGMGGGWKVAAMGIY